MGEFRDLLDRERRRFTMPEGSIDDLERRRDRKRRNHRIATAALALVIAAAGIGGGLYAFRPTGEGQPAQTPTPSGSVRPTPAPSESPSPIVPPTTQAAPFSSGPLQFVDDERGWAVVNGKLMSSSDGGLSWHPVDTSSNSVDAVDFLDPQRGWVVSGDGLRATSDGGSTWVLVNDRVFIALSFVDVERGWGISSGEFLQTRDGGRSWTRLSFQPNSFCVANAEILWAVGPGGDGGISFYRSADGGASWAEFRMPLPNDWSGGATVSCAPGGSEAFATAIGGAAAGSVAYAAVQATSNGASVQQHVVLVSGLASGTFHPQGAYVDNDPYLGVFTVVGPGSAYFVNWCGACEGQTFFLKTEGEPAAVTDRTELPSKRGGPDQPLGISFVNSQHGWLLLLRMDDKGQHPFVLETKNGGSTWMDHCDSSPSACFAAFSKK